MPTPIEASEFALTEIRGAQKQLGKSSGKQVRNLELVDLLKSVSHSWFRNHRQIIELSIGGSSLTVADAGYTRIIDATTKQSAKSTYKAALKDTQEALVRIRGLVLRHAGTTQAYSEQAPDFSRLVADPEMQSILNRRWEECKRCLRAEAHLAATVMMGGFLEALFVARANQLTDQKPLFTAKSAPIDKQTKKVLPLTQWTLRPYIDVAEELKWITRSGKDVAAVLRDYRNYIHPEKERSHRVGISHADSALFWDLTKNITKQLLT